MHDESASDYCPPTPDTSSLYHANSNVDDLTLALTNISQVPSLESQQNVCCCCNSTECQATKSWLDLKEKLEKRLHLSAEVGSALLQRHEAYVRRHESDVHTPRRASEDLADESLQDMHSGFDSPLADLMKDNAVLEKRLTQALLNSEVAEASHKTVLHELEEARMLVTRLTAYQARTVGIDSRLAATLQENDDLRQERDSQAQREKTAEARIAALKDRTDKLQAEVRRLQADLELRRLQRLESSESLLQDVRSRLEGFHHTHTSSVLESLVSDNELLTDSREDLQVLQSQVEEHNIFTPPIRGSGPSSFIRDSLLNSVKRPLSMEPRARRVFEPLTPETSQRPLSPADSMVPSETKYSSLRPQSPPSHFSFDADEYDLDHNSLLTNPNQHSKAVQTDRWLGLRPTAQLTPSLNELVSSFPHDGRSDSSSLLDGQPTHLSALLERVMSLLSRMSQADALTLTKRLKRQHLRGADVKHLSRTTVSSILSEITQLRAQYRMLLEDEKVTLLCSRKDLRGLFKLFKDMFEELGQMRVTLNDIILEPSIAQRVSEMSLDPAKAEAMERERKASGPGSSWMAPFSKLFGSSLSESSTHSSQPPLRPESRGRGIIRQPRPVPKLGPALAASTTIVNVEFSGAGVGKSVTSTFSAHPTNEVNPFGTMSRADIIPRPSTSTSAGSNVRSVMGIFAGAPHPDDAADPWVVLPRGPRRVRSTFFRSDEPSQSGTATIERSVMCKRSNSHLSRGMDPDADLEHDEANDIPGPLLERTLRRRGLSDSSIHSTYMSQAEHSTPVEPSTGESVLQTLSRTMRNFSFAASQMGSSSVTSPPTIRVPGVKEAGSREGLDMPRPHPRRAATPTLSSLVPNLNLASWAAGGATVENPHSRSRAMYYGSVRDDSVMPRPRGRED
ncbi:uncharacterized protein EDB91DRAFT_1102980 [Suillus paluster]|uniref:uncharacterized protein n=1 Tax=Suillus paluster TaxID=48578 RepID=UPI001B869480|nr:uncharacterized protein EDB91DRAFT_1102980 [Suillus paluster]KAG1752508.1 hypothetical protein EDB91DRAFT_1102980 [Suillus paluster]